MKVGGWSLRFDADQTPWKLRQRMTFFSNIIITPAYSGPLADFDELKAQSLYSGILTRRALRRGEISGWGLLGYLATGKATAGAWHAGYETMVFPALMGDLIDHWFNGVTPYANGIRKGTNYADTPTTLDALSEGTIPDMKQTLDTWASSTGNEYRVTPQGLIDYGTTVYAPRNILLSPDVRMGTAGDWKLWEPSRWDPEADVEDYRNTGRVLISDKSASGISGSGVWATPGAVPRMRTWDNDYGVTCIYTNPERTVESLVLADATKLAVGIGASRAKPHYSIGCEVPVTAVSVHIDAGDYLYVYDALEGIQGDTHTGIPGFDVAALLQRVYGFTWPVEEGMGVYLIDGAFLTTPAVPEVFDLTPYIEWETGPATLELGEPVPMTVAAQSLAD